MPDSSTSAVLVSVGNTRTRFTVAPGDGPLEPSRVMANASIDELSSAIAQAAAKVSAHTVLVASVNEPVAAQIARQLDLEQTGAVRRLGAGGGIAIPVEHTLADAASVGQDRLLNALGAFSRSQQACIIIDAGTAVTVDFVDGHGIFHGGAIAPGLTMMRDALHERTAALPRAEIAPANLPAADQPPFGKTTVQAINLGVTSMVIGLAHLLIDRYAEFYEAYPRVIATGGDAPFLFENDPLVEHIVPDLALIGMHAAWTRYLGGDEDDDSRDDP